MHPPPTLMTVLSDLVKDRRANPGKDAAWPNFHWSSSEL
jgi:hypothetical protein